MFRCPDCDAAPGIGSGAGVVTVRHAPSCPLLIAATRDRWTLVALTRLVGQILGTSDRVGRQPTALHGVVKDAGQNAEAA
jgi:hypothetical protein